MNIKTMFVKTVLFDLDGTLIDSIGIYHETLNTALTNLDLPSVEKNKITYLMSIGKVSWNSLLPTNISNEEKKLIAKKCMNIILDLWPQVYREKADLFPGTALVLQHLKDTGFKIGLVTSSPEKDLIIELLKKNNVWKNIDILISREDVSNSKPAPDGILLCINKLRVSPQDSVYIGDSVVDIKASKSAGTKNIAVLSGAGSYKEFCYEKPDLIIKDIRQIPVLLNLKRHS